MKRVLVTSIIMQRDLAKFRKRLQEEGIEPVVWPVKQFLKEGELLPIIDGFDGVIAGDDQFTEAVLQRGSPRLKVISKWGVGLDAIDREAAKRLGIRVYNTPGVFATAVAEVAIGYLLMLSRKLHIIDAEVKKGKWPKLESEGLKGKVLGIVGFGAIGKATTLRALAFGMEVIATDIQVGKIIPMEGVAFTDFDDILSRSDYLCLCCNLTPENEKMIGAGELRKMKSSAYLINVARGALVDEDALINALNKNIIAGVALDVYGTEPLPKNHPFTKMGNVILGSHNANNLREINEYVNKNTIENLLKGLSAV